MIYLPRNFIIFTLISLFHTQFVAMEADDKRKNVFDLAAKEHQLAISESAREKEPFVPEYYQKDGATPREDIPGEEIWRGVFERQHYESHRTQFIKACTILKDSGYFPETYDYLEMDINTRKDLQILQGPQKEEEDCLANKTNKTTLFAGRSVFCTQLVRPYASDEQLIARNLKVNALLKLHKDSCAQRSLTPNFDTLEAHMKNAVASESVFQSFFDKDDAFSDCLKAQKTSIIGSKRFAWIKKLENWLNDNPIYLYYQEVQPMLGIGALAIAMGGKAIDIGKGILDPAKPDENKQFFESIGFAAANMMGKQPTPLAVPKKFFNFLKLAFDVGGVVVQGNSIEMISSMVSHSLARVKYMRKKLHYTAKMVRALKDAQSTLEQLSSYHNGKMLVDLQLPQSEKAKHAMELLSSPTFANENEGWKVHWGKVKLTYKRMVETIKEFSKAYAALGELDYLMGSARLIINNPAPLIRGSTQKASYTVSTFTRNSQTPALQATNCWNPLLKKDAPCVINNLDISCFDGKKVLIISGPNGKGKTVFMASALYGTILSQALGVAPAKHFSQTAYKHLITFIKTETKTSQGQSLFRNVCARAKAFKDILDSPARF